jgi:Cof subfamily protein (haloacid dehalogenase superfamily)
MGFGRLRAPPRRWEGDCAGARGGRCAWGAAKDIGLPAPKVPAVIRLVACDLDGTLLDDARRIPAANRAAIAAARASGVRFVICTGRPPRAARVFWQDLGLDEPVVGYNGALIWDMAAGRACWEAPIAPGLMAEAIAWARACAPGAILSVEAMDRWWTDRLVTRWAEAGFTSPPDGEGPVEEFARQRPAHKLLFRTEGAAWQRFAARLPAGLRATCNRAGLVEVSSALAGKAAALSRLAPPDEVLALGDDANDLDMLRWAADSAAPSSGTAEARAAARRVVADHNLGAVADALRRARLVKNVT